MMEANSGDTSTTPLISPPTQIPLCPFCLLNPPPSSSTMVSSVVLTKGFLTQLPVAEGGGTTQEDAQGEYVESGSMGGMKRRVAVFWHQIARSPPPQPPPSCGFMAYLPVVIWLWVEISGRSVAEILTGAPGEKGSPAGLLCWTGWPRGLEEGDLPALGQFNTPRWPIKLWALSPPDCAENRQGHIF